MIKFAGSLRDIGSQCSAHRRKLHLTFVLSLVWSHYIYELVSGKERKAWQIYRTKDNQAKYMGRLEFWACIVVQFY